VTFAALFLHLARPSKRTHLLRSILADCVQQPIGSSS
jgi:hypothetical protein